MERTDVGMLGDTLDMTLADGWSVLRRFTEVMTSPWLRNLKWIPAKRMFLALTLQTFHSPS